MSNPHANHQGEPGDTGTGGSGRVASPPGSHPSDQAASHLGGDAVSIPSRGSAPGDLNYRSEWEASREISHEEAREIARRLIASHFRRTDCETARVGIPARPDYDDDLLICSYIKQQSRKDAFASRGWQPIATAPKDGTPVLVGWDDALWEASKAHYEDGLWGALSPTFGFDPLGDQPTHWMPLPATPRALAGEAEGRDRQGSVHEHAAPQGATP